MVTEQQMCFMSHQCVVQNIKMTTVSAGFLKTEINCWLGSGGGSGGVLRTETFTESLQCHYPDSKQWIINQREGSAVTECIFKLPFGFKMCCTIPANSIKCLFVVAAWLQVDVNGWLVD